MSYSHCIQTVEVGRAQDVPDKLSGNAALLPDLRVEAVEPDKQGRLS